MKRCLALERYAQLVGEQILLALFRILYAVGIVSAQVPKSGPRLGHGLYAPRFALTMLIGMISRHRWHREAVLSDDQNQIQ